MNREGAKDSKGWFTLRGKKGKKHVSHKAAKAPSPPRKRTYFAFRAEKNSFYVFLCGFVALCEIIVLSFGSVAAQALALSIGIPTPHPPSTSRERWQPFGRTCRPAKIFHVQSLVRPCRAKRAAKQRIFSPQTTAGRKRTFVGTTCPAKKHSALRAASPSFHWFRFGFFVNE